MELTTDESAGYRSPFDELVGTRIVEASGARAVATLEVRAEHHQPTGVVHGGVYATVIEALASAGATLALDGDGVAMGISNSTDFLRAVTGGTLHFVATPIQVGRTLQLWQVEVSDEAGRPVAHGKVKLYNRRARG